MFGRTRSTIVYVFQNEAQNHYDVAIVGAGPAGATCGYFLG